MMLPKICNWSIINHIFYFLTEDAKLPETNFIFKEKFLALMAFMKIMII